MTSKRALLYLAILGIAILALVLAAIAQHLPGSIWAGTPTRKNAALALLSLAAALYGLATALVLRTKLPSHAVWLVLAIAIALRVALILSPPFTSTDIFRYVWDGRVQAAGINPYAYVPADPTLAALRDPTIYPRINRAEYARTIYPPAAEALFLAVAKLSPTVTAMKIGLVLMESAGILAMLRVLKIAGLPPSRILIYAWNPLAAWSAAGDGHIDAAAIGWLGLALLARATRRDGLAGALLGGAILTKLLPLVVAPALWRRWDWRMPTACAGAIATFYGVYATLGWLGVGSLGGYVAEEGFARGGGFWPLGLLGHLTPLPHFATWLYLTLCLAGLAWIALRIGFVPALTDPPQETVRFVAGATLLATATMLVLTPHYPWYYPWLALPACLAPWRSVVFLSVAPLLLYWDPFHDEILVPTLVFLPALVLVAVDFSQTGKGLCPLIPLGRAVPNLRLEGGHRQ